jgi:hypothetical protein
MLTLNNPLTESLYYVAGSCSPSQLSVESVDHWIIGRCTQPTQRSEMTRTRSSEIARHTALLLHVLTRVSCVATHCEYTAQPGRAGPTLQVSQM